MITEEHNYRMTMILFLYCYYYYYGAVKNFCMAYTIEATQGTAA